MSNNYNEEEFKALISIYNYKELLNNTFNNIITPMFKERGFMKKGRTFYRERDGIIEICNVQYSSSNHKTSASFTYNIGIAIPGFYESLGIAQTNRLETTIYNDRFGTIILALNNINSHGDYWYRLEAYSQNGDFVDDEPNEATKRNYCLIQDLFNKLDERYSIKTGEGFAKVVIDDIDNYVIKFFNLFQNAAVIVDHLNNDNPRNIIDETMMLQAAELYYFNNDLEKGKLLLNKIKNGIYKELLNRFVAEGKYDL